MIEQDAPDLPGPVHRQLARYRRMATSRPTLANAGLIGIALTIASNAGRFAPIEALARCVSTQVFHTHHLDEATREDLPTVAAFEAFVGALPDPDSFLMQHL